MQISNDDLSNLNEIPKEYVWDTMRSMETAKDVSTTEGVVITHFDIPGREDLKANMMLIACPGESEMSAHHPADTIFVATTGVTAAESDQAINLLPKNDGKAGFALIGDKGNIIFAEHGKTLKALFAERADGTRSVTGSDPATPVLSRTISRSAMNYCAGSS